MKEFLEKRWWQGIGGIAGITAIVIGLLQWRDILHISGIAVSIALNIIFAIVLVVLIVWGINWKRKYKDATSRIEEMQRETEKPFERKRVLLPDSTNISRLNIDNALLNELYGQASGHAVNKYHDAKLNALVILVHPYNPTLRVSIMFGFYSEWANRVCRFHISETQDMHELLPGYPAGGSDKATFDELPWVRDQNWPHFLKKSCERVGPLSPNPWTDYTLSAYAFRDPHWGITFGDGVTGKRSRFEWDGIGEPIPCEGDG